jgi:DNA-binding beta-propeller fold protein YncE
VNRATRKFLSQDKTTAVLPGPPLTKGAAGALVAAALVGVLIVGAVSVPAYGASVRSAQGPVARVTSVVSPTMVPGTFEYPITSTIATGNTTVGVAANPATNRIYAINENTRSVAVINGSADTIVTTVGLGIYTPVAIAVNATTDRVFVLAIDFDVSGDSVLLVIDGSTNAVIGSPLVVGGYSVGFAIDAGANTAFVSDYSNGTVTAVNTATMTTIGAPIIVGSYPAAVAIDSTNHTVYVSNYADATISVIDGTTRAIVGSPITVSTGGGAAVGVDESLHRVFVADNIAGKVTVIDGATRSVVGTPIVVGDGANGVAVDSSTHAVYVSGYGDGAIGGSMSIIDSSTNTVAGTAAVVGVGARGVSVNPTTNKVYVANYGSAVANSGSVSVISPTVPTAFADVTDPNNAFFTYIQWMFTSGISTGTPQPSGKPLYNPSSPVSRQAMASFLFKLSGETFVAPSVSTFADVDPSATFFKAIEWMASKGISTGTPQASGKPLFKPTDAVSRQAMALFLARYAHANLTVAPTVQSFADVPLDAPAAAAVKWMKDTGISTGTVQPSGLPLYKPVDPVSRSAMAAFLYRLAHLPV